MVCAAVLTLSFVQGCEERKPLIDDSRLVPSARKTNRPKAAPAGTIPKKFSVMPIITVEQDQTLFGSFRLTRLETKPTRMKLQDLVKALPNLDNPVTFTATPKSKISDVAILVAELGKAGVPRVIIKTKGRGDLPGEIQVVPESKVEKPDGCSVVATTREDHTTAVWAFKGGPGKKHRKGLAGPDLTQTLDTLKKKLPACKSRTAFFSAHKSLPWELAFNIGASIVKADDKGKIETLVLLGDEPVAGRPVKLAK